ncbi:DUF4401 domain-containing protein [Luteitalea sp.]|uniref:DUF4401 domain-containing protein n=1 Tax=Luteitalea sp. TaxID=2004800 RepID=UPI0025C54B26|nr:DUF4401 domain-containing protein [Luteitalea sp.]
MMPERSLGAVLREASQAGWLRGDADVSARAALSTASHDDLPWYLRVLIGAAAWVGALFLLGTVMGLIALVVGSHVDGAAMLMGLALMPAGVGLRARGGGHLLWQCALVMVIAGELMLIGGFADLSNSLGQTSAITIVSSALLIAVFRDGVYRFCATLAIVAATLVMAFDARVLYALALLTAVTAAVPVLAWRVLPAFRRWIPALDPVAWASATATCGLLALQATLDVLIDTSGYNRTFLAMLLPVAWPLTAVFVTLIVGIALQVARDHAVSPSSSVFLAVIGASVALGVLTHATPAVSGALLLVVLGFDRRRTGLVTLGGAFLIGFLGIHYYSLSLTLLQKSAVLVASGAVCLLLVAVLRRADREVMA